MAPDPRSLYAVGPVVDVGVYPLTTLTAMFGPARRVRAYAATLEADRTLLDGTAFTPGAPDFVVAVLEHEDAVVTRLTTSFYVGPSKQQGLELHGDSGSLWLATWWRRTRARGFRGRRGAYADVPLVREPFHGIDWSRPPPTSRKRLEAGRPHRSSGEHGAHLVEIFEAVERASERGGVVDVRSDFIRPEPMDWAR